MTALVQIATAQQPVPQDMVGPGTAGFIVIFLLALATVLLVRSMVGHLRKVRYGPGPEGSGAEARKAAAAGDSPARTDAPDGEPAPPRDPS